MHTEISVRIGAVAAIVSLWLVCVTSSAFAQPTPTSAAPPATRPQRPPISWVNPRLPEFPGLSHHVLASKALGHDVGYVVCTPAGYAEHPEKRYPVIYFLHGAGGNEAADSAGFSGHVAAAVEKGLIPPVICVYPNGGMSGYRGPVESMIVDELIPLIDRTYRTIPKQSSRAVAGFSMGGGGAVNLAFSHPDLFCAASMWGAGTRPRSAATGRAGTRPSADRRPPFATSAPAVDLMQLASRNVAALKAVNFGIIMVNGDRDRPDGNVDFAKHLEALGIANKVIILPQTAHDLGRYYDLSADQILAFIGARLKAE